MSIWIDYEIQREFTDWADLCDRHNAEVDELQRRLDAAVDEVRDTANDQNYSDIYELLGRVADIAKGRDNA